MFCLMPFENTSKRHESQQVYATSLVLIGIVLNPLSGILFDCLGCLVCAFWQWKVRVTRKDDLAGELVGLIYVNFTYCKALIVDSD